VVGFIKNLYNYQLALRKPGILALYAFSLNMNLVYLEYLFVPQTLPDTTHLFLVWVLDVSLGRFDK